MNDIQAVEKVVIYYKVMTYAAYGLEVKGLIEF